jgi:hypothetical protein
LSDSAVSRTAAGVSSPGRDPDYAAVGDQRGQVLGAEPVQARVQPVIRRERRLGLQPHQVLDDLHDPRGRIRRPGRQGLALEQQLAGQERAVDRTQAQYLRRSHQ